MKERFTDKKTGIEYTKHGDYYEAAEKLFFCLANPTFLLKITLN